MTTQPCGPQVGNITSYHATAKEVKTVLASKFGPVLACTVRKYTRREEDHLNKTGWTHDRPAKSPPQKIHPSTLALVDSLSGVSTSSTPGSPQTPRTPMTPIPGGKMPEDAAGVGMFATAPWLLKDYPHRSWAVVTFVSPSDALDAARAKDDVWNSSGWASYDWAEVPMGLGRVLALYHRPSTAYQIT